jgi:predicted glycoside hydrolase/deacetylase ChbG (UPF0249 family)
LNFEDSRPEDMKKLKNHKAENSIVTAEIVVNADDFGYSSLLNHSILKSFELNLHSTTTLMCNMPGFEEACDLAFENKIIDRIGIHLNMTEGKPLTEKIKKYRKFVNENGELFKSFKGYFFSSEEKNIIYEELQAQVDRFKSKHFLPTHIDSHHHFHFDIGAGFIIKAIAIKNKIPAVRLRFNWGKLSIQRRIYSRIVNGNLFLSGLAKTSRFCEIRTVDKKLLLLNKPIEVMVHPIIGENDTMLNYVNGENLEELVKIHLPKSNFITYDYLNKQK